MAIPLLTVGLVGLFIYAAYRYAVSKPKGFPPVIPRIPFFGSYLFMMATNFRYLHKAVWKFSQWFKSDIIGLHMGPYPIVVVHNQDAIREVLNRPEFDGRPALYLAQIREPDNDVKGIFFIDGPEWEEQRRFILRYLRDYGFGRRSDQLEAAIQEELSDMVSLIRNGPTYDHERYVVKEGGYRIQLPYFFNPFAANCVFHVLFNERYPRSEQVDTWTLMRMILQFTRTGDDYGKILSIMPWVRHIFPNISGYNKLMEANKFIYNFYNKLITQCEQTYDESAERHFIDVYIKEMKKAEKEGKADTTTFNHKQFVMALIDFTFPAITNLGTTLAFLIQYFLLYPEVQKKMQKEIDTVVGPGRFPTLDDRKDMPYTEACIREIMRIETLVPSNVAHRVKVDTDLMGYHLPKDTIVMASLYALHNDERVWGDPQNFRPERFLDDDGKLCLKKDHSLPFGAGKRLCAGETFGRNLLFLMTATMSQNFNFVLGPNDKLPDLNTTMSGLTTSPTDFWVQVQDRICIKLNKKPPLNDTRKKARLEFCRSHWTGLKMAFPLLTIGLAGLFIYLSYRYAVAKPKGFPPVIPRIPIFGSYLFMMMVNFTYLHKAVWKFSKWLKSDIVGLHMGKYPIVVVHDSKSVREVLTRPEFNGRPSLFVAQIREPNRKVAGIFFKDGQEWEEQRRFILRYARDFGFGRRSDQLEAIIQEELSDMLHIIRTGPKYPHEHQFVKEGGYRVLMPYFFNPFSANSVYQVLFNERYPRSEQADMWKLIRLGVQFQRTGDDYGKILSIMPWVRHIFPNWSSYNKLMESNRYLYEFYEKLVDRYIATYDESAERHFVDIYIKEMKKAEKEGKTNTTFNRSQFVMALVDFTFPASTAVGMTMAFLVQYLLLHPEVQRECQKEIDNVVGSGRLPTLDDRQHLPYTEASIREMLRIETLVPSNVPHRTRVETELMGYRLPKDTFVMTSLYALHNDENLWGDPQNFRPERFLDENGKLSLKKDHSLPFGAGKRLCAGETFARNMLFLMTATMLQNFNFVLGPNDKMPDVSTNLSGLSTSPRDYWVQLEERKL
ncbi:uncharacterized protein LOC133327408 [Musca vetustissima]|uniref:uncharacterized protein LOC133327408 n=1 Tax=Musca vetustissima TaxID=27455 RepID=UPI002AB614E9|nr:uncharacterized protein LOC133327408 [Musca vetustissima]